MIFGAKARQIEAELQEAHSRINALVKANYILEARVLDLETNVKTTLAKIAAQEAQERELASINHKKVQARLQHSASGIHSHNPSTPPPCGVCLYTPQSQGEAIAQSNTANLRMLAQGAEESTTLKANHSSKKAPKPKARKEKAAPKRSRGFMINRRNKKDTQ